MDTKLIRKLLKRIDQTEHLAAAKAYADCVELQLDLLDVRSVRLLDAGPSKIKVIKVLRNYIAPLTLQEAIDFIKSVPVALPEIPFDIAQEMIKDLAAVGAKAE